VKTIKLKSWLHVKPGVHQNEVEREVSSKELIESVVKSKPVDKGFSIEDMRNAMKILDAVERSSQINETVLILEDEQYNYLKNACSQMQWAFVHSCFIEFVDSINEPINNSN
jgi:hypothetical protein